MTHEAGKGDTQRPTDHEKFSANYDAIFKRSTELYKEIEDLEAKVKTMEATIRTLDRAAMKGKR